jgi:hypothetical protein
MRYWLYRVEKEFFDRQKKLDVIKMDYLPEPIEDGESVLVFVGSDLVLVGAYVKKGMELHAQMPIDKDKAVALRLFYGKISIVTFEGPRTYKVFSKKAKEITKEDFELMTRGY